MDVKLYSANSREGLDHKSIVTLFPSLPVVKSINHEQNQQVGFELGDLEKPSICLFQILTQTLKCNDAGLLEWIKHMEMD